MRISDWSSDVCSSDLDGVPDSGRGMLPSSQFQVVTDRPDLYDANSGLGEGVTVHHRDELDALQCELRDVKGVTVIVYEQTCAAEKRRRRKRGKFPDRQEEHNTELPSLMRITYDIYSLKTKNITITKASNKIHIQNTHTIN